MVLETVSQVVPQYFREPFEGSRWVLISICVIGVLLAYITDEGYSLIVSDGVSSAEKDDNAVTKSASGKGLNEDATGEDVLLENDHDEDGSIVTTSTSGLSTTPSTAASTTTGAAATADLSPEKKLARSKHSLQGFSAARSQKAATKAPWSKASASPVGTASGTYSGDRGCSAFSACGALFAAQCQATIRRLQTSLACRLITYLACTSGRYLLVAKRKFLPEAAQARLDALGQYIKTLNAKLTLFRRSLYLKRVAKSRRHYFYLLEKELLGLPITKDETEIDSYLDCKHYLGKKWPFMWEVSNVKKTAITCAGRECIPMSSYSYLDLVRDDRVQNAAIEAAKLWSTGNHGPRMLGGNTSILIELEQKLAEYLGRDACLLCATGYLACMSACAAISGENTVVFGDARLHASLRAGLKIGQGKTILFAHNDFDDLEKLMKAWRHKFSSGWLVIESVYSMDGDIANLPEAVRLARKYNCKIVIDEAHGLGVMGPTGRGLEEHFGMPGVATLVVGTFSKSVATIGGYIAGPQRFIDYLDFHAPGNVFSAPLPAYCAGGALKAIEIMSTEVELVKRAQDNSKYLRTLLESGGNHWPADYPEKNKYVLEGDVASTVIPVVFNDDIDRVMRVATAMKRHGFMVSAVAYPACPLRRPRFRITATTAYTKEIMDQFVKTLVQVCVEEPPSDIVQLIS